MECTLVDSGEDLSRHSPRSEKRGATAVPTCALAVFRLPAPGRYER